MDESKKGALRTHHQRLRTGLLVGNILPVLSPVFTDVEYSRIRDREDNISRVDELIEILLTKENRHFDAFCTALEKNGYKHWAVKLQKQVDEIEGPEVNAPLFSQTQVQFPIIDELADDFALLMVNVKRKLRSLSDSQLQDIKDLVEEKLKSKRAPITIPSSADRLINFISQYWDFLSFELAQLVVRHLGKKDLQTQLQTYEESLRRKAEILLTQCREKNITPRAPPGCFSMKITVDEDPYSFSLHRILEIKDFLVHRIGIDMALFTGWHSGSIILHFCILEGDMEAAARQLHAHKLELRAMQVVAIEVGDVIVYPDAPIERLPSIAATFVWPEQPESITAKDSGIFEDGSIGELENQRSLEMQAMKLRRLTSEITTLRAALAKAREENASRREHEAKLQSQCETSATRFDALQKWNKQLMREIDNEKKANHELAERCEQLQLQVNAYEEDFKAERHDRESAQDKFADKEKEWMEQLENHTQERDQLTGNIFALSDQLVAVERELEARTKEAAKVSIAVKALEEEFGTVVAKKDEEIQRMTDLIRELQPIADQYKVLQHQFDAVLSTNHEVQQMLRNMQSEKAAAERQVKELSMVVGQLTAENEALNQQNSQLAQQNETLAAKDGSKHPVRDQQEIDKQLPKAAADATPEVLTFANISLKEPLVVTPKSVAPPVVIPEALLIDDDTRKPPAVMPEEPVIATPIVTSAAPPKTAPSTIPKKTPNATPNDTPVAAPTSSIATPRAHVATPRAHVATPRVPVATSVDTHSPEQDSDTQDANMKDAPSCEKCGKIFPWNQRRLLWKHMQECTGSAESGESVSKPTPLVARSQTLPQSSQSRYTGLSTTSRSSKSDTQAAATDEDAPKCEKCGRIFPWNQLQLRWKHKCEPTEVARAPDPPRRRIQSSASNLRRPVSVAHMEGLFTSSTVELGVRSASEDATRTCKCGKIFAKNQRREFVIHKLQCREGTPPAPPSAGRHYRGATLPRQ